MNGGAVMTKILPLVVALAVVALVITACGENALAPAADETPVAEAPAADTAKPADAPALDADTVRALADELARLRAQIAAMQTAQAPPAAPTQQLVAKVDEPIPLVEDGADERPDAPPPIEAQRPDPAPRTVIVERSTLVERETPVYVDREVPVIVDREVPVYVDREVIVEQPPTVVVVQSDDCVDQFRHDAFFAGAGFGRGGHDDHHGEDRRGHGSAPQARDVPAPVVRHDPPAATRTPHPRVPERVEHAPLPVQSSPAAVPESTRAPFDPPAPVVVRDPPTPRKPTRQPDGEDRPRQRVTRVEQAPLPAQPPATRSAPEPQPTTVVVRPAPSPAPVPLPPPPPPPSGKKSK
jgi:hypothetical protein